MKYTAKVLFNGNHYYAGDEFQDQKLNLTPMALLGCMMTKITIGAGVSWTKKSSAPISKTFTKLAGLEHIFLLTESGLNSRI